jgi:hypothetical protein
MCAIVHIESGAFLAFVLSAWLDQLSSSTLDLRPRRPTGRASSTGIGSSSAAYRIAEGPEE